MYRMLENDRAHMNIFSGSRISTLRIIFLFSFLRKEKLIQLILLRIIIFFQTYQKGLVASFYNNHTQQPIPHHRHRPSNIDDDTLTRSQEFSQPIIQLEEHR